MYSVEPKIKVTTTYCLFCSSITSLYEKFVEKNNDISMLSLSHNVAQYIHGGKILCATHWHLVDHVVMPINVKLQDHWICGRLNIAERLIYLYNSLRSGSTMEPFLIVAVDGLPEQYFIDGKPIPSSGFDVEIHRDRLAVLFYHYGMKKQLENIESEYEAPPNPLGEAPSRDWRSFAGVLGVIGSSLHQQSVGFFPSLLRFGFLLYGIQQPEPVQELLLGPDWNGFAGSQTLHSGGYRYNHYNFNNFVFGGSSEKKVVWRINGANSMVFVNKDVACLGFVDGGPLRFVDWGIKFTRTSIVIGGHQIEVNLIQIDLVASRLGFSSSLLATQTTCSNFNFTSLLGQLLHKVHINKFIRI
ncbi:hypothetical protein G4B88_019533 [Cannabis sativa]|uniref:Uncharacterized protein n=1 Tax=Cannabis sativa TaxID=3483 RepID=A0A7J6DNR6_CANSA|nr:hypothetical protein G4B88_019533 [Cannabis sativa]